MAQTLNWSYQTGGLVYSSPAVGSDGTIYIGSTDSYLYALNSDGTLKWRYQTGDNIFSSPAIGSDDTIYIGSNDNYLYALNADGTLKWRYQTGGLVFSSPAIDSDGTIYVGSNDNYLYALNPDGTLKWRFRTDDFVFSSPSIDTDGTIYIGSYDNYLYALNPDGTLKWRYQTGSWGLIYSSPAIDSDGTIYVGSWDSHLHAINSDGTPKWKFQTGSSLDSSPAIDSDGTIYVGSYDMHLYALNPDGTLKWKFNTGNFVGSSPAIGEIGSNGVALFQGNNKVIFVGSGDALFAVYPDGTAAWVFSTESSLNFVDSSPTIASGSVIAGCSDGYVYAVDFKGGFLASAAWAKFKEGLQCTSQAQVVVDVASPTLTLDGEGYWSGCPDELPGEEVTILSFSLSADDVDSWKVDSIRFESSGSGNEYEHIDEVILYEKDNPQPLSRSMYLQDDESITLTPMAPIFVPLGGTINLRLVYKFKQNVWIRCPLDLVFRVRTRPDWISARPVSYPSGSKEGEEIEGIIAFGCVKNTTTNKTFNKIQEAIDDSETKDGHTIVVCPGTYTENVEVTKNSLTIRSRDGRDVTTVQAQDPSSPVFRIVQQNNITIKGFTIKGGNNEYGSGVYMQDSSGTNILDNIIADNYDGVRLEGCEAGTPNVIKNNDIKENKKHGIHVSSSFGTNIINNTIELNEWHGIEFSRCEATKNSPNIVEDNDIKENDFSAIDVKASFGTNIINNTIASNKVRGITISRCEAPKDSPNLIEGNNIEENKKEGVGIFYSFGTNIINNTIDSNVEGVGIFYSFGTNIINNTIASNVTGIEFRKCEATKNSPNVVEYNDIKENTFAGISLRNSSGTNININKIWHNLIGISLYLSDDNKIKYNSVKYNRYNNTGIHLDGSSPEIIGNTISDDAGDGIKCENGANPTVRKNNITNNTGFGLNNIDASINIDAQENWWGDASGPAGAGPGTGDEVSENVVFSNWRTEPVAFTVIPGWDVYGARGTEVTATFYIANLSDSNDTYNISVSDTLGWGLYPTTLTETVTAGESKEILITISIPLNAPIATEDEITLAATSTSNPTVTDSAKMIVTVGEILINEVDIYAGRVELYNPGPQGISLAEWKLINGDGELELTIPEYAPDWDGILEGGAYLVIHLSSDDTTNYPSEDIYGDIDEDDIEEVLSEEGNSVAILNPSGGGIDFVRYGDSQNTPPAGTQWHGNASENPESPEEDQSLGRDMDSTDTNRAADWEDTSGADADFPTPGWQNILVCISARSGNWKDADTWEGEHIPRAIDDAVICEEHIVTVNSLQQCKQLILPNNSTLKLNDSLPEAADGYDFQYLSVVDYSGSGPQTISTAPTYGQLIVSGSGTKTANDGLKVDDVLTIKDNAEMQNKGQMTVERHLELEDSSILTLGDNLDVNGDLYISEGATLNGGSYTINLAGDWNNSGTYNYGTSTVVFDQSVGSQFIGPLTDDFLHFYNLTISTGGSPGTTTSLGNLHVHGDLAVSSGSELVMGEKELIVDGSTEFSENRLEGIAR